MSVSPRFKAMVEQVRKTRSGAHAAEREIGKAIHDALRRAEDAKREAEQLQELVDRAIAPRCTLKEGFTVPEITCKCGAKAVPFAYHDGEGWGTSMHCLNCQDDVGELDWPFNEDSAYSDDFEDAGFEWTN